MFPVRRKRTPPPPLRPAPVPTPYQRAARAGSSRRGRLCLAETRAPGRVAGRSRGAGRPPPGADWPLPRSRQAGRRPGDWALRRRRQAARRARTGHSPGPRPPAGLAGAARETGTRSTGEQAAEQVGREEESPRSRCRRELVPQRTGPARQWSRQTRARHSTGPARVLRRAPASNGNRHAAGHLRALWRNPLVGCVVLRDDLGGNPATLADLVAALFGPRADF